MSWGGSGSTISCSLSKATELTYRISTSFATWTIPRAGMLLLLKPPYSAP